MKTIFLNIKCTWKLILPLFLFVWFGCEDKDADYVKLSANSYTFAADGSDVFKVTIEASKGWSVEIAGDWISEKEKDNNSITIGATATQSNRDRTAQLIVRAGDAVEVVNFSQLGTNVFYNLLDNNSVEMAISPGGKYIAGVNTIAVGEDYEYTPFKIEVATGHKTEYEKMQNINISANSISDNGIFVIVFESDRTTKYYDEEGKLVTLKLPAGFEVPTAQGITTDGKILVGYAKKISDKLFYPVKWENGEPTILEAPTETLLGETISQGTMARGCSADGSVIYGSVWDDFSAVYWKDGKVQYLGLDKIKKHTIIINDIGGDRSIPVADKPIIYADYTNVSPNGKYIATTFMEISAVNKAEVVASYPAVFDTEKGELTILTDLLQGFEDGSGRTVSDNGLFAYGCPAQASTNGFVYDINSKTTLSMPDFVKKEYGLSFSSEESLISKFTNDGKTVLGVNVLQRASQYQFWYLNVAD